MSVFCSRCAVEDSSDTDLVLAAASVSIGVEVAGGGDVNSCGCDDIFAAAATAITSGATWQSILAMPASAATGAKAEAITRAVDVEGCCSNVTPVGISSPFNRRRGSCGHFSIHFHGNKQQL